MIWQPWFENYNTQIRVTLLLVIWIILQKLPANRVAIKVLWILNFSPVYLIHSWMRLWTIKQNSVESIRQRIDCSKIFLCNARAFLVKDHYYGSQKNDYLHPTLQSVMQFLFSPPFHPYENSAMKKISLYISEHYTFDCSRIFHVARSYFHVRTEHFPFAVLIPLIFSFSEKKNEKNTNKPIFKKGEVETMERENEDNCEPSNEITSLELNYSLTIKIKIKVCRRSLILKIYQYELSTASLQSSTGR